jgi:hypothetical protein
VDSRHHGNQSGVGQHLHCRQSSGRGGGGRGGQCLQHSRADARLCTPGWFAVGTALAHLAHRVVLTASTAGKLNRGSMAQALLVCLLTWQAVWVVVVVVVACAATAGQ